MTALRDTLEQIRAEVSAWPGVTAGPHRFGGVEFTLGGREIGHIHPNGMVDIPFSTRLRQQLIAEGRAEPHHLLADTGWISFYIRAPGDTASAIWLFRLAYLFYAGRGRGRSAPGLDYAGALAALP